MKKGIVFSILLLFFFNSYAEENTLQREYFILNQKDTKIYAIEDGKVLTYGFDFKYGNYIEIEYFTIGLKVKYCNLGQIKYFFDRNVKRGNLIAKSGITGTIDEPGTTIVITLTNSFLDGKTNFIASELSNNTN